MTNRFMNKQLSSSQKNGGNLSVSHHVLKTHEPKAVPFTATKDPHVNLGDFVCEILTFSYSDAHREALRRAAREMGGTLEQIIAAAIAGMIAERYEIRYKMPPSLQDN